MCRLQTPQLEEALKGFPLYSQDGKGKEAICRAIFTIGSARWFILEGEREDGDTIMFGIAIGLLEDEYGYVSLKELSEIELNLYIVWIWHTPSYTSAGFQANRFEGY